MILARIDNDQYGEMENIDFIQTLYAQLAFLRERAESNRIKVNVEINNNLHVRANKILMESLIINLIVNAIRHNIENGMIDIQVSDHCFIVSNTGTSQSIDKEKVFRRFNRKSEEKKGNGLGLSIVHEICKMHGWTIHYDYKDGLHSFVVRFT